MERLHHHRIKIKEKKRRKLNILLQQQKPPQRSPHTFYQRLVNLSNTPLNEEESRFLQQGLKHAVPPINPKAAVDNLIPDLTVGLRDEYALTQCGTVLKETPIEKIPHNRKCPVASQTRRFSTFASDGKRVKMVQLRPMEKRIHGPIASDVKILSLIHISEPTRPY